MSDAKVTMSHNKIHRIDVDLTEEQVKSIDTGELVEVGISSPLTNKRVMLYLTQGQIDALITSPANSVFKELN